MSLLSGNSCCQSSRPRPGFWKKHASKGETGQGEQERRWAKGHEPGEGQGFPRPCNYDKVQSHAERGREETYLIQPEAAEGSFHGQKVAQGGGAADVGRVGGVALHIPGVEDGHLGWKMAQHAPLPPALGSQLLPVLAPSPSVP